MKAAVLAAPRHVVVEEVAPPEPGPGEVLVRVRACGLNRADVIMASGAMHGARGGPGARLGLECAGEVAALGAGVTGLSVGDRVMGGTSGAFAEQVVLAAAQAYPIPADLDFATAATLPIALQTMHDAIVTNGGLQPGESVLIQGASSGVGLMGLQIARLLGAGTVIGTSTHPERRARLGAFGADLALDTADPGWAEAAHAATGGVDLIIDQVSGGVFEGCMRAAAVRGRIVNVGRLGGQTGPFDFDLHALKRLRYIGVTFRTRTPAEVAEIVRRTRADLWPALEAGRLRLPVDRSFAFAQVSDALDHMRANRHFGKIVLTL